ncbi:putative DNA modification/repair radical SAM protein [Roseibacillus ishigakijimensis]|uniref:putative DNA modification/repair radical SAM protein n=1 Tax=Roseibacillus ishigakijimensis TaxID=454146 RepID=UPI001F2CD5B6|nr:putative DNA modification/repair radical SAM protein [Roseibacillus ishigakijimensis]
MILHKKLSILADAAKYDASCSSSGGQKRDSTGPGSSALGSTGGAGICHSYTPDGRCVSLLKILLTNACIYDCHYCINRRSSNTPRARFTPQEVVQLTLDFYKRNYIEGLFLSSGIIRNPDYTMEQVVEVARSLREDHHFRGYLHLKTIPEASAGLIEKAGQYADRISINIELPTQQSLNTLAPEKNLRRTRQAMGGIRLRIEENQEARRDKTVREGQRPAPFSPAGQSTQMIIGADDSSDHEILHRSNELYSSYKMRRVYYSAFSPIPDSSPLLPAKSPPLVREHRLYQADWLLRYYGYSVGEIADEKNPSLDLELDPKLSWALRNRSLFPVDVNRAAREDLLRIPGIGVRSVQRILSSRRHHPLRLEHLQRLGVSLKKCRPFLTTLDYSPAPSLLESEQLRRHFLPPPAQLELDFAPSETA